jgi:uncharacterized protein YggE
MTVLVWALWLVAQDPAKPAAEEMRTISVSGEALVRIAPDEVHVTFGIDALDKDIEKSRAAVKAKVGKFKEVAKQLEVDTKNLGTEELEINPEYCSQNYCKLPEHGHVASTERSQEFVG